MEVVDFALGKARDHVEAAGVLELARKSGREVTEKGLRLHARLLREVLGAFRALRAEVREDRRGDGADGEHDADGGDLAGADQRVARCGGPLALLLQHLLGGFARLALMPQVAAGLDHAAQHVVGQFDAAHVEPFLDAQQPPVDERRERVSGAAPAAAKCARRRLLRDVLAEAGFGQQLVLDDPAHGRRLVRERALVEIAEDGVPRAGQQVQRDLVASLGDARVVELAADEAEQRGLDLGIGDLRAAGHEAHDRLGDLLRHEALAGTAARPRGPAVPSSARGAGGSA